MSLWVSPRPTQAGDTIKWTTVFLEDATQAGLQAKIEALPAGTNIQTGSPQGGAWLADIQYQATDVQGNMMNYSVMLVIGAWNPT